jgi:hypothetical protein
VIFAVKLDSMTEIRTAAIAENRENGKGSHPFRQASGVELGSNANNLQRPVDSENEPQPSF